MIARRDQAAGGPALSNNLKPQSVASLLRLRQAQASSRATVPFQGDSDPGQADDHDVHAVTRRALASAPRALLRRHEELELRGGASEGLVHSLSSPPPAPGPANLGQLEPGGN